MDIDTILQQYNCEREILNNLLYLLVDNNNVYDILLIFKNNNFNLIDCFAINTRNDNYSNTIYYHLLNYENNENVCIYTHVTNKLTRSIIDIFENANWYEREIYEMYNINFVGHNNLRKLFTEC
ncbi:MAG: NADH-quinone oxidoreductase subunit C [Alphaproteobacteria bacterium]|nr:NADH-quinone oxidoreductase subunit C [Alphaproteobacteria bacterium]